MDFNDSFVLLLTCCSSHVAFRPFINRERRRPSYFPVPATIFLTFAARLRRFCPFLVSRGWIRNLAARCPEVGLEFCSVAIFGAKCLSPCERVRLCVCVCERVCACVWSPRRGLRPRCPEVGLDLCMVAIFGACGPWNRRFLNRPLDTLMVRILSWCLRLGDHFGVLVGRVKWRNPKRTSGHLRPRRPRRSGVGLGLGREFPKGTSGHSRLRSPRCPGGPV